jgi:hypothetical protein
MSEEWDVLEFVERFRNGKFDGNLAETFDSLTPEQVDDLQHLQVDDLQPAADAAGESYWDHAGRPLRAERVKPKNPRTFNPNQTTGGEA